MAAIHITQDQLSVLPAEKTVPRGTIDWWNSAVLQKHIEDTLRPFAAVLPGDQFKFSVASVQRMVHQDCPRDVDVAKERAGDYIHFWLKNRAEELKALQIEVNGEQVRIGVPQEKEPMIIGDLGMHSTGITAQRPNTPWNG